MRNIVFLITLLIFSIYGKSQVTFAPNPIEVTADKDTDNIQTDFDLKNEGKDTVFLAWELEIKEEPEAWENYICDTEICYNLGDLKSKESNPNVIPPGEEIVVMFHVLPDKVKGAAKYELKFYDQKLPDSINVTVPISVNTITASNQEISLKGLNLFPNPATDHFKINTGDLINRMEIANVIGKTVKKFSVVQGKEYDVTDLDTGIYYVRLLDSKGNSIKVLKLKKI